MKFPPARTAADVLTILKSYRDELHEKALREPAWPVLERLISRETEMNPVWHDIARHALTGEQCWNLLEQVFFAGAYGTAEHNRRLKDDHAKLAVLNEGIAAKAAELGRMLTERENILNRNSFNLEYTAGIVDLIDAASGQNGHYLSFLRKELHALRSRFDGKYWPSLQQLLEVVAKEHPVAVFMDRSDEAVVRARGVATPDFLRRLFSNLHEIRVMKGDLRTAHIYLPADFRLTDASLATLATVSLDLAEPATEASVKMLRNRLYDACHPGAWANPVTIQPGKAGNGSENKRSPEQRQGECTKGYGAKTAS
ncbi:hypothetical protein QMT27_19455 [Cronobacter dublinensis]|uniref:hypothetical protein n=1 Tax=Cronobacter dublinensis TaxID=413497 RepID=UPI003AE29960